MYHLLLRILTDYHLKSKNSLKTLMIQEILFKLEKYHSSSFKPNLKNLD